MDSRRISQLHIISFLSFIDDFFTVKMDKKLILIHGPYFPCVPVINSLVIIISSLHDFVTGEEMRRSFRNRALMNPFLYSMIEMVDTTEPPIHGGKDLHGHFNFIIAIMISVAKFHDIIKSFFFGIDIVNGKFAFFVRNAGLAIPNQSCIPDDPASLLLTENMDKTHNRHFSPLNQCLQGSARAYGRQLIHIPHKNQSCPPF